MEHKLQFTKNNIHHTAYSVEHKHKKSQGGFWAFFMPSELDSAFWYRSVWGFLYCTWMGCLMVHTGPCVSAGRDRALHPEGELRCIWEGGPQRSAAFSAAPAPSVAAFSTQRDRGGSRQADLKQSYKCIKMGGWWHQRVCWEYLPNRSYPAIGKNDLRLTNTSWTIAKRIKHQLCEKIKWIWRKVRMCSAPTRLTHWNRSTGLLLINHF